MALTIGLAAIVIMLLCAVVILYHALTISIAEREVWYTPIEPIEFDMLDGEEDDGDR